MANLRHGMSRTSVYGIWAGMIARCHRVNDGEHYQRYGARGITVCDRWRYSFENFFADMGDRPSGLSIERVDNTRGYSPDNCVWASKTTQQRNRRTVCHLTVDGETKSLPEWCEQTGMHPQTVRDRLKRGWTHDAALKTPIGDAPVRKAVGTRGVGMDYRGKWFATFWNGKKTEWLGYHDTQQEANEARKTRELKKDQS